MAAELDTQIISEDLKSFSRITTFDSMGLDDALLRGIYGYGFETPSVIQQKAIVPVIRGNDVIAQAQSGTGKTATFAIGLLQQLDYSSTNCQGLILAPTRELAQQIQRVVEQIGDYLGAKVYACIGGTTVRNDLAALRNGVQVVVGTPGRVLDLINRNALDLSHLRTFILDEADEMLGRGFKEQIYNVFQALPPKIQVALFSATMSNETLEITENFMNDPVKILVKQEEVTLEGIRQFYINCEKREWKLDTLVDLYDTLSIGQAMIFCNTKKMVMWLTDELRAREHTVSAIHGELEPEQRNAILNEFRTAASRILITTNLLARGIDVHGVSLVINYDLPREFEHYIHRIGRCGRHGRKGVSINLISQEDFGTLKNIEQFFQTKIEEMPSNIAQYL